MVGTTNSIIGFDRKIHLSWLDATAEWTAQGLTAAEVRTQLERLLEGQVAGDGPHNARGKTITVLLHIWVAVPDALVPFRDEGLVLLRGRSGRDRLPVHWGMCLATYPFFREVAATTGRLLALQGTAALSQIVRRMTESWGERSTLTRAVQRVVRSFVEWGILVGDRRPRELLARGQDRRARDRRDWSVVAGGQPRILLPAGTPFPRPRRRHVLVPIGPETVRAGTSTTAHGWSSVGRDSTRMSCC